MTTREKVYCGWLVGLLVALGVITATAARGEFDS